MLAAGPLPALPLLPPPADSAPSQAGEDLLGDQLALQDGGVFAVCGVWGAWGGSRGRTQVLALHNQVTSPPPPGAALTTRTRGRPATPARTS